MFKGRGGHNVKEPDFFVLFCFVLFCFGCCFLLGGGGGGGFFWGGGGGGRMFLRGNEGRISRYQLSIKGGLQRIDSQ